MKRDVGACVSIHIPPSAVLAPRQPLQARLHGLQRGRNMWAAGSHVSAACAAPGFRGKRSELAATATRPPSRLGGQSGSRESQPCRAGLAARQQNCGDSCGRTCSSGRACARPAGGRQVAAAAAAAPPAATDDPEVPPASTSGDRSHDTDFVIIGSGIGGAGLTICIAPCRTAPQLRRRCAQHPAVHLPCTLAHPGCAPCRPVLRRAACPVRLPRHCGGVALPCRRRGAQL